MTQPQNSTDDPFDSILTLEDDLYTTAYTLGTQDGARAGRIEGRVFGLEKGFEKFAALGQLHGRACIWGARITPSSQAQPQDTTTPSLPQNPRLKKHITTLHSLTDPATFSTLNTEDAVADFDDRFKRAGAKAKITERIIGEPDSMSIGLGDGTAEGKEGGASEESATGGSTFSKLRLADEKMKKSRGKDDNMEDFAGSRFTI